MKVVLALCLGAASALVAPVTRTAPATVVNALDTELGVLVRCRAGFTVSGGCGAAAAGGPLGRPPASRPFSASPRRRPRGEPAETDALASPRK